MTVFIDRDRSKATGWEGYDIAINRTAPVNGITAVEAYEPTADPKSFTWKKIGEAEIRVEGNKIMYKVPRGLISDKKLDFEFKCSDNMVNADAMDFYENGSSAPLGRFNYLFKE